MKTSLEHPLIKYAIKNEIDHSDIGVANWLGVSPSTVANLRHLRRGPSLKLGGIIKGKTDGKVTWKIMDKYYNENRTVQAPRP